MAWTDYYVDPGAAGANNGTSLADAWTSLSAAIAGIGTGPAAVPTRVNVKAATYAHGASSLTFNTAGTTSVPVWWRGFKETPGDQDDNGDAVAGVDIPLWTWTTGQMSVTGAHQYFSNIAVTSQCVVNGNGAISATASILTFYRFRCTNTGAAANGIAMALGTGGSLIGCNFSAATSASSIIKPGGNSQIDGCYLTGGSVGLLVNSASVAVTDCVFDRIGGDNIQATTSFLTVTGCSFYGNGVSSGNGIIWTGTPPTNAVCLLANNYFENFLGAGVAGINNASGVPSNSIRCVSNAYFNCTNNKLGFGDIPAIFSDGSLPSAAFADPAGGNFAVREDAQSIGFPGSTNGFEALPSTRGYMSFGAVQPQAGGGGTSYVINKIINNHYYDSPEP